MFLRVAGFNVYAGFPEFPPKPPIFDHQQRVPAGEDEELGPDPEFLESDLRLHHVFSPGNVPAPQKGRIGRDLYVARVLHLVGELTGIKEKIVKVTEGVEGYAVLRYERKELVRRVVQHCGGDEAARGGDESGRGSLGPFSRDEPILEDAPGRGNGDSRVGVDVDVVEMRIHGWGSIEEELPKRGKVEVSVGEEEEGDFGAAGGGGSEPEFVGRAAARGAFGESGLGDDGLLEEGEIVELVGGGDGETARRKNSGSQEEKQRNGDKEGDDGDEN